MVEEAGLAKGGGGEEAATTVSGDLVLLCRRHFRGPRQALPYQLCGFLS